jgi:hypothetical protein
MHKLEMFSKIINELIDIYLILFVGQPFKGI